MHRWQDLQPKPELATRVAVLSGNAEASVLPDILEAGVSQIDPACEVEPLTLEGAEFEPCVRYLKEIGFRGAAIENPLKVWAARIAERFYETRHALGVANALGLESAIYAQNTEVPAFMHVISDIPPTTALVMGTGQNARSVCLGLLLSGWRVKVWNRNAMKSRLLLSLFNRYGELELVPTPNPAGCSLIVNATPLGTKAGEQPPLEWDRTMRDTTVVDLVYRRVMTDFLRAASLRGFRTVDGRELLVEQMAQAIEVWTHQQIDRAPMLEAAGIPKTLGPLK